MSALILAACWSCSPMHHHGEVVKQVLIGGRACATHWTRSKHVRPRLLPLWPLPGRAKERLEAGTVTQARPLVNGMVAPLVSGEWMEPLYYNRFVINVCVFVHPSYVCTDPAGCHYCVSVNGSTGLTLNKLGSTACQLSITVFIIEQILNILFSCVSSHIPLPDATVIHLENTYWYPIFTLF